MMSEEEKQALEILRGLEFYEYEWYVKTDKFEGHANEAVGKVEKAIQTILNLIDKQQKEIKARLEEIDSLYKMLSVKDEIMYAVKIGMTRGDMDKMCNILIESIKDRFNKNNEDTKEDNI